ncbi:uncharacterized protein LOC131629401 [Vicia villosa]|uniref:uncharacterized protein LOC131629401 n=1 Tax=Vicia villosa TaxID=3911 RepID=UPI00273B9B4D|nr:uncharacterized protein LOC131629401 [Vicia villosa]
MAGEDVRYDCYAKHHETVPFDEIALYSGWLAASSTVAVRYLPERVLRQFGYAETIPHDPTVSAPIAMTRRHLVEVFADWEHYMVHAEAQATRVESDWSCVEGHRARTSGALEARGRASRRRGGCRGGGGARGRKEA